MNKHMEKRKILLPLVLFSVVGASFTAVATLQHQNDPPNNNQRSAEHAEFEAQFPIAEYSAAESADPVKRAKRQAKSKKYDNSLAPLSGGAETILSSLHWEDGLSALPADKSHAVVIGKVTSAEAYVSNDKTGVYSEFTVHLDEILKNSSNVSMAPGGTVSVERSGGRVRLPSGQVALMYTRAQGMPRVGRRYVFFLSHDFPLQGRQGKDLYILTVYEVRAGRIHALDSPHGHPITAYRGKVENSFLEELRTAIANP
jgi:hypothetical protein